MRRKVKKASPYVWTDQYRAAIRQVDEQTILVHINSAETFILRRRSELLKNSPAAASQELSAITRALETLIQLREIEQHRERDQVDNPGHGLRSPLA